MMYKLYFILLFITFTDTFGQDGNWVVEISIKIDSTLYSLKEGEEESGEFIDFIFPPYKSCEPYLSRSIDSRDFLEQEIFSKDSIISGIAIQLEGMNTSGGKSYFFRGTPVLSIRFYSSIIDTIYIRAQNKITGKWNELWKNKTLTTQTFQPELRIPLSIGEKNAADSLKNQFDFASVNDIGRIKIFFGKKEKQQKLILGELKIFDSYIKNIEVIDDGKIDFSFSNYFGNDDNNTIYYSIPSVIKNYGDIPTTKLELTEDLDEVNKISYVSTYIYEILKNYKRYNEHGINKFNFLQEYSSISLKCKTLDELYHKTEILINTIHDTHFALTNRNIRQKNYLQPIHFYKIKNNIEVVAVFDTSLSKYISLGDKLVEINGQNAFSVLEKFSEGILGNTYSQRERKAVQSYLFMSAEQFGTELTLKFERDNEIYSISLSQENLLDKKNFFIPNNYRKSGANVYQEFGDLGYLRISDFGESKLLPFIYSYLDSIKNKKGLILDLRNNYHGDLSIANMLAFFIEQPAVSIKMPIFYPGLANNTDDEYESIVVKPDPYYNYSNPIVVIVDSRTTCDSELFIKALKKARDYVYVIGNTRTSGAAQLLSAITLPSTDNFRGLIKFPYKTTFDAFDEDIDLKEGIGPDIYVPIDSYTDLVPFNDKLLQTSLKFLNYLTEISEYDENNTQIFTIRNQNK